MRKLLAIALSVLALGTIVSTPAQATEIYNPKISAHRGTRVGAPENTIPAFAYARAHGAFVIETDVQWTSDGVPIIMHDATFNRTTNCTGWVKNHTLKYAKSCDAGTKLGYKPTAIPTFEELLMWVKNTGMELNAEIKMDSITAAQGRQYLSLLNKHGMYSRNVMSSMSTAVIRTIQSIDPKANTALISQTSPGSKESIRSYGTSYMPTWMYFTPGNVATLKRLGVKTYIWPVRTSVDFDKAYATRADYIVVDDPAAASKWLAAK